MACASPDRLAHETSAQSLRRIGADVALTKIHGELALLSSPTRGEAATLAAFARIRALAEAGERAFAQRDR